ncbi:Oidioi.mRNA.OKI2018_I69.XSR.g15690.t1.cds [Oikopleura dioica]|uniref:Oidioi.mRNA.OKI2018_I69.XSR.g15690.t1.cds n=1 Tax=Oikopleura dioica TaxID=34765 RepID=A0ABN7SIR6_OIKDI|nr:Oidioi.mRNA.OKI2018_I69.XSR.g15690.t1.cds [Oikopleura dioica]
MFSAWWLLPLLPSLYAEETENDPEYNDGISQADVAMVKNFLETSPSEWDPLDQGQFARGSVVPGEPAFGEVVLVGTGIFENPDNPDGIYGCKEEDYGSSNFTGKVAFLYRGICKFEEKVTLAAEAGAEVVVIVNNNPEGVITMSIGKAKEKNVISLMITNKSGYQILQELKEKETYENVFLKISKGTPTVGFEKIIVIVICLAFLVLLTISLAWVIFYYVQRFRVLHQQYRDQKKQEQLMRKALDALKVEILTSSSEIVKNSDETCCAICIDNFEAKDVVRHLTCCHLYHKKCIDPWLMEKGTCPQCKVDILKQLGLRDAEEVARGPSEEDNTAFSSEERETDWQQATAPDERDLDSGVEDEDDHQQEIYMKNELEVSHPSANYDVAQHQSVMRALSEPLPPVNCTTYERTRGRRSSIEPDTVSEINEESSNTEL